MPSRTLWEITLRIWWVLPSRMSARTALLASRISKAAIMPPSDAGHEALGHHAGERRGQLDPDLGLPLGREHVDDAVERRRRVVGVQRGEHEVTGLGDGQRGGDALGVAHLAHEHDVGVLAERGAEAVG